MKRIVSSTILAMVLGVAAFTMAGAQQGGGGRPGGRGGPGFGGPGGRGGPGLAFGRIDDLSDAQREQIKTILEAGREGRQGPPAGAQLQRQLEAELLADAPDDQKIETLKQQIAQANAEGLAKQIDVQRKIAQVLTPEQRAKARARLSEAPPQRGRREGRESARF